jgi:hypothetical protein
MKMDFTFSIDIEKRKGFYAYIYMQFPLQNISNKNHKNGLYTKFWMM